MKHFQIYEFDSPDEPGSGERMDSEFLAKLDHARDLAETPFMINSGLRTVSHNKKVGGKKNSSHLSGLAVDIACANSRHRFLILSSLIKAGFHRIGIANTFIHVDDDETKDPEVIWTY